MLKVTYERYNDLSKGETYDVSNNGHGKEYAGYLRVTHKGDTILLESDAMEPEDCTFSRDLNWVKNAIQTAYMLGLDDNVIRT